MYLVNIVIHFILPLVFLIAPMSIIIHEMGHLLGARIVKADHYKLSIGKGKKIFSFSCHSLQIIIRTLYFTGGEAKSRRKHAYKPFDISLITAGGPLLNLVFALMCYSFFKSYPSNLIGLFILFNLWLGVGNLIPFKVRGKPSDGYLIFKAILECVKS